MEFAVNVKGLKSCSNDLDVLYKQLGCSKITLDCCKRSLSMDMLSSSYWGIRTTLNNLSKSINNQMRHIKQLSRSLDDIADIYSKAELSILDIEKTQAEIDEKERHTREVISNIIKFATYTLCTVATVAVVIGTGGAAAPLALGIVGGITGSVLTATNEMCDEYVEKGNLDEMDWKRFGKDVAVSGITGFVTGYVGGALTKGLEGVSFFKSGLESTKFLPHVASTMGIESIKEVTTGLCERYISGVADNLYEGKLDLIDINKSVWNPKEIGKDALGGAIEGTVDDIVGSASTCKNFDSKFLNSDNAVKRTISNGVTEGSKGVISGAAERFEEDIIDGRSFKDSFSDAFDAKKAANDFVSEGAKGGAKAYKGEPVGEQILTKEKLNNNPDLKNSMPNNTNAESWIDNGGKIYKDSAGKITFEKPDEANNTAFKHPKIREYYDSNGNKINR